MEMRVKYTEVEEKLYIALLLMENYWTILVISYSPEKKGYKGRREGKTFGKT